MKKSDHFAGAMEQLRKAAKKSSVSTEHLEHLSYPHQQIEVYLHLKRDNGKIQTRHDFAANSL